MHGPLSNTTVIGSGKVREVAETCATTAADIVIFTNDLTERQRATLSKRIGVRVQAARTLGLGG
jgi:50S ribosomal subunit-associated GTPase HflX